MAADVGYCACRSFFAALISANNGLVHAYFSDKGRNIFNVERIGVNLISMYTQSLGRLVYGYGALYTL